MKPIDAARRVFEDLIPCNYAWDRVEMECAELNSKKCSWERCPLIAELRKELEDESNDD